MDGPLRLAFKYDPKTSKIIVKKIFKSDKKINSVINKLDEIKIMQGFIPYGKQTINNDDPMLLAKH